MGMKFFTPAAVQCLPAEPMVDTVAVASGVADHELTLVLKDENGNWMLSYTPVRKDANSPLPEIVEPPLLPHQIENTEECFLVGLRNLQFHNPFVNPVDYFEEVLRRDPRTAGPIPCWAPTIG